MTVTRPVTITTQAIACVAIEDVAIEDVAIEDVAMVGFLFTRFTWQVNDSSPWLTHAL